MTLEQLNRRIKTTSDLGEIVNTMKMLSSVSVGQYEKALFSLTQYAHTVQDAFHGLFTQDFFKYEPPKIPTQNPKILSILIGTDNGLVGKFNRTLFNFSQEYLHSLSPQGEKYFITVGKRMGVLAQINHLTTKAGYAGANSVKEIAQSATLLLTKINEVVTAHKVDLVYLFNNRKKGTTAFIPQARQLIPLPQEQMSQLRRKKWDGKTLPFISADKDELFSALLHEYLIVTLSHDLTSSLTSEHYTRMIHMQEAQRNINDSLDAFNLEYQQLRQTQITDELIDIVSGAEEMNKKKIQSPLDFSAKKAVK